MEPLPSCCGKSSRILYGSRDEETTLRITNVPFILLRYERGKASTREAIPQLSRDRRLFRAALRPHKCLSFMTAVLSSTLYIH